jgi:hypothetical protein
MTIALLIVAAISLAVGVHLNEKIIIAEEEHAQQLKRAIEYRDEIHLLKMRLVIALVNNRPPTQLTREQHDEILDRYDDINMMAYTVPVWGGLISGIQWVQNLSVYDTLAVLDEFDGRFIPPAFHIREQYRELIKKEDEE